MGSEISSEGDVYSFGVLLLENVHGKQPIDEAFKNGTNLSDFGTVAFSFVCDKYYSIMD
jgi:hypothetical protein